MMDDFSTKQGVTRERMEAATEWLVHNAARIGDAKATKEREEHMLKVVKALAMKASGEKSAAAQEREAYASEQYQDAVDAVFEETRRYEVLLAKQRAAITLVDAWRSMEATLRNARV